MQHKPKVLVFHSVIMLVIVVLSSLATYLVNMLLARFLGAEYFGNYSVIISIFTMLSIVLLFGNNYSAVKFLPEYITQKKWQLARGYLKKTLKIVLITCIAIKVFGIIVALILLPFTQINLGRYEFLHVACYMLWVIPLIAIGTYLSDFLRGINRIFWSTLLYNFLNPILFIIVLLVTFYLFHITVNIYQTFFICAGVLLVIIFLQFLVCRKKTPKEIFLATPDFKTKEWHKTSWQLMVAHFVLMMLFSSEMILLKIFGHSAINVGIFSAILTIGSLYWLIFNAVAYVLMPHISPSALHGDRTKMQALYNIGTLILTVLVLSLTVLIFIFRYFLLRHFGAEFVSGVSALVLVTVGYAAVIIFGLPWYFLGLTGNQQRLLGPIIFLAIFNIIITIILVHYFDLMGAAVGLVITDVLLVTWQSILLKKHVGIKPLLIV
jgi:O-antigen/teichoic acid export membrane protein